MLSEKKRDFFISYTKDDTKWAEWIAEILTRHGYTVYLQAWNIKPGDDFVTRMNEFLVNSNNLISIWSVAYSNSNYCMKELNAGFRQQMKGEMYNIFPVRIQNIPLIPLFGTIVSIDLFDYDLSNAERILLDGIRHNNCMAENRTHQAVDNNVSQKPGKDDGSHRIGCSFSFAISFSLIFLFITSIILPLHIPIDIGWGGGGGGPIIEHPSYSIFVQDTSNGIVRVDRTDASSGERVFIKIIPFDGYVLDSIDALYGSYVRISLTRIDNETFMFYMPPGDVTIYAVFRKAEYKIHIEETVNGRISLDQTYAQAGTIITLIPYPNQGCKLQSLHVVDEDGNIISIHVSEDGEIFFYMPDSDVIVIPLFEKSD